MSLVSLSSCTLYAARGLQLRAHCACRYGFRGKDCRANVLQLPTKEVVYFVAATVVLYDAASKQQRHYVGHTDDIKWYVP